MDFHNMHSCYELGPFTGLNLRNGMECWVSISAVGADIKSSPPLLLLLGGACSLYHRKSLFVAWM